MDYWFISIQFSFCAFKGWKMTKKMDLETLDTFDHFEYFDIFQSLIMSLPFFVQSLYAINQSYISHIPDKFLNFQNRRIMATGFTLNSILMRTI